MRKAKPIRIRTVDSPLWLFKSLYGTSMFRGERPGADSDVPRDFAGITTADLYCFENPEESLSVIPLNRNLRMQVGRLRKRLEQENASPLTQLHALQLVLQLLIALHERLHLEPIDSRISRVCEAMKNDPARNWSNADGAEMCDLAVNAFIRKFRMETGMPPYRYLTCLRYSIAANLLESSSMGLKEICGKIGIKDPFHFSREFKRIYERPPSVHRKRRYIQTTDLRQTPEEESGNPPTPR